jgi:hypothetical protein
MTAASCVAASRDQRRSHGRRRELRTQGGTASLRLLPPGGRGTGSEDGSSSHASQRRTRSARIRSSCSASPAARRASGSAAELALFGQLLCCSSMSTVFEVLDDGLATFHSEPSAVVQVQPVHVKPDWEMVVPCSGSHPTR